MANDSLYFYILLYFGHVYNAGKQLFNCRFLDYYITFAATICRENTNERRTHKMISQLLGICAAFSWTMETTIASILLFGEYPSKDIAE